MEKTKPRARGRPKSGTRALLSPVMVRFPLEMLQAIDALVAERLDRPDRSGMIRQLIAEALAARQAKLRRR